MELKKMNNNKTFDDLLLCFFENVITNFKNIIKNICPYLSFKMHISKQW